MFFFNKKHTIAASGILQGAADHHSHILPGVDDGVETMDEALRILTAYEALGIKELWLTPHIMEDIPNTPQKLKARFDELKAAYKGNIKLHLAAEYMIDNHLRQLLQETNKLRHSSEGRWHEQSEVTEGSKAPNAEGDKTSEPQGEISLINNCPSCVRGASDAVAEGDKVTEQQGEISESKLRHSSEGRWHEQNEVTEGSKTPNGEGNKTSESQGEILLINNCPSCVRGASDAVAEGDKATEPHGEISLNSPSFQKREYPKGEGDRNPKQDSPLLPIGNAGKHILVETSYYNSPMRMDETLQQIKSLGYFPLLAHPERYMYLGNTDYTRLHSQGVKYQLNLASLAGGYGKTVKKKAEWLLANGLYTVAGSDLHCEDAIEFITKCELRKHNIEQVNRLLHNVI